METKLCGNLRSCRTILWNSNTLIIIRKQFSNWLNNMPFGEGLLPTIQKHAIVSPRLKKPSLNWDELNSYRPISDPDDLNSYRPISNPDDLNSYWPISNPDDLDSYIPISNPDDLNSYIPISDPDELNSYWPISNPDDLNSYRPISGQDDLNSYWPISDLSFISRTIELVVAVSFNEHADAKNLLPVRQSAYRAHHSTETVVIAVHNDIAWNVDCTGQVSVLVLLDLSAAFDTVDHNILLDILEYRFGITGLALKWYQSYLVDRIQTSHVGLDRSIAFIIDCSVPQGSALGLLKFIAYTEDLPSVIEKHELDHHLYADNTQIADHLQLTQAAAANTNIERCVGICSCLVYFQTAAAQPYQIGLHRLHGVDLSLHIGADIIAPLSVVHDLGVFLDSEL